MRLAPFILRDMDGIVADWEAFASTLLPAARDMASLELLDHAREVLHAIAEDLQTPQTPLQQAAKSKGQAPFVYGAPQTAAQTHAILRARSGFDINQLVAEYRALRASVLRRWMGQGLLLDAAAVGDMVRFNEAVDQAIAESVAHFHDSVERARNLLLGMLGHDMRSPLNTIVITASHLAHLNAGEEVSGAAARLIRSGASMRALLDDLVDFNRTRLGLGIKVVPADVDLGQVLADEVEQLRGALPSQPIEVSTSGDTRGRWDGARLQQVLRNLVLNAARYGTVREPIRVDIRGEERDLVVTVINVGAPIKASNLNDLFEPLKQGSAATEGALAENGLGLGLFIVREIVKAHGGHVEASCTQTETAFAVRLPR